jgi:phytoene/squalene synthetase
MNTTAILARKITWTSSKQSYLTALLLVDSDLVNDCMRAYAYFRWADDRIDLASLSDAEREAFIARQLRLVERLYQGEYPEDLCPEEMMLANLISHDRGPDSGLRSFIRNFMAVITFDARRKGRHVSRQELADYTAWLATAVMDGIQYFIGNGQPYPRNSDRIKAVTGAHLTHMLRDTLEDIPAGLINIPAEGMQVYGIRDFDLDSPAMRLWVRDQVKRARICFQEGKRYIDALDNLRCKLAGVWYCARFECILNAIERDGYRLRSEYPERHGTIAWVNMFWLGIEVTTRHITGNIRRNLPRPFLLEHKVSVPRVVSNK